jgi:UDP-N-acetylglucosamine 2-epimerase (non-hydrolysing)
MLDEFGLLGLLQQETNIILCEPLSYLDSLALMADATFVMTDSGGIQEETTVLSVPCLTLRENTERPVTITEGTNELVGKDKDLLVERAFRLLAGGRKEGRIPQLWDGKASERIVGILLEAIT